MLHWLARDYFAGNGVICDLGSFLGGSTAALASGLQAAGRSGRLVHSYDRHDMPRKAWRRFNHAASPKYPADGNFLPLMQSLLGDLGALVHIHSGEFPAQPVPEEPIEILFVDIAKAAEVNDHVVAEYFPRLIPGHSIVVQQDYFHFWPYWDVVVMEILADHFTPLAFCEANSALFLTTKAVDAAAVERALFRNHDLQGSKAAIRAAGRRWDFSGQRARLLAMLRGLETFDALPTTYPAVPRGLCRGGRGHYRPARSGAGVLNGAGRPAPRLTSPGAGHM